MLEKYLSYGFKNDSGLCTWITNHMACSKTINNKLDIYLSAASILGLLQIKKAFGTEG